LDSKKFAITGVAGYVAPRHLRAIKDVGGCLSAAVDPHDSVGIIDSFFPDAAFFTEYERFDRYLEKSRRMGPEHAIEWVSICSPNYLHDAHVRTALRVGANAICEKPLVIEPKNLDALADAEMESVGKVWTVLQLRVHPRIIALREHIESSNPTTNFDVTLTYVAPRGNWYAYSWKAVVDKSGGICTNIGIHLFDLLIWLFGPVEHVECHISTGTTSAGILVTSRATIRWFLTIDWASANIGPNQQPGKSVRKMSINEEEIDFSDGFSDLHTAVYRRTLAGNGHGINDARPAVELTHKLRGLEPTRPSQKAHPLIV